MAHIYVIYKTILYTFCAILQLCSLELALIYLFPEKQTRNLQNFSKLHFLLEFPKHFMLLVLWTVTINVFPNFDRDDKCTKYSMNYWS